MPQPSFYPVVHLLTGPPGLDRNGGIWKTIKKYINKIQNPTHLMVQALHFTTYNLGTKAWDEWFYSYNCTSQLQRELQRFYGPDLKLFIDSGGYQLLYKDVIDLSKWGVKTDPESILNLQLKFNPSYIASLDFPIMNGLPEPIVKQRMLKSIDNSILLLELLKNRPTHPLPFLVIHGRNPKEISFYMNHFHNRLKENHLISEEFGLALGSQVPLSSNYIMIKQNIQSLNQELKKYKFEKKSIHIFGIGDSIAGEIKRTINNNLLISYDNSTYVQNAMRSKIYSWTLGRYQNFDHKLIKKCPCFACKILRDIEKEKLLHKLTQIPAYGRIERKDGTYLIKSNFLGLIALHNLYWTEHRQKIIPHVFRNDATNTVIISEKKNANKKYRFPLAGFNAKSPIVLLMQCSKEKPYSESKSYRYIINNLEKNSLYLNKDFDIVTLSGLHGPIHWKDEQKAEVLFYDYKLNNITSNDHVEKLRFLTSQVLNITKKRYEKSFGLLTNRYYQKVFFKTLQNFNVRVLTDREELINEMISNSK